MNQIIYAGFWIRFVAALIDTVVFFVVFGITLFPFFGMQAIAFTEHTTLSYDIAEQLLWFVTTIVLWLRWSGKTPGKKLVGIRIVSSDFGEISTVQAIIRYLGYFLSTIILCLGFIMVAVRTDKRGLHDLIANTYVIYDESD